MDENVPIEIIVDEVKISIARYANGLCQQYSLPPILIVQILQEIVYENRINMLSSALTQLRSVQAPKQEIDISSEELINAMKEDNIEG